MQEILCDGWWQQRGLGRQPMRNLALTFDDKQIHGRGVDIVAPFTLAGKIREDGAVELVKQYRNRHSVLYVGQYDGEGLLYGQWDIDGFRGQWSIKLLRPSHPAMADDIQDL